MRYSSFISVMVVDVSVGLFHTKMGKSLMFRMFFTIIKSFLFIYFYTKQN